MPETLHVRRVPPKESAPSLGRARDDGLSMIFDGVKNPGGLLRVLAEAARKFGARAVALHVATETADFDTESAAAIRSAKDTNGAVAFVFNGVKLAVNQDTTPDALAEDFCRALGFDRSKDTSWVAFRFESGERDPELVDMGTEASVYNCFALARLLRAPVDYFTNDFPTQTPLSPRFTADPGAGQAQIASTLKLVLGTGGAEQISCP